MTRWNGSLIGVQKNTSLTDSTGVWNLRRQTLAKQNGVWPLDNSTIPQPNWSLDFSSGSPWANGTNYTFVSTTSTARTYVNNSGYVAPCVANLWTNSEVIASWPAVTISNCNTAPNSTAAPDGTTTSDTVSATTTNSSHFVRGQVAGTASISGANHTWSVYLKAGGGVGATYGYIAVESSGTPDRTTRVIYDLTTGARTQELSNNSPTGVESLAQAENCGNGWWRVWIRQDINGTSHLRCIVGLTNVSTSASLYPAFAGASSDADFIYVWGAQYVIGSAPLPYSATTTSSNGIPRLTHDINGSRLGLLIEGSVTNGLPYSNDLSATWELSGVTRSLNQNSPANDTTALRLVEQAGSTGHVIYANITRTNVVFSAYLKKDQRTAASMKFWLAGNNWCNCTFNLDAGTAGSIVTSTTNSFTNTSSGIENAGNNWYRCWIRATVPTNSSVQHSISLNTTPTPTLRADNGSQDYEGNTANGIFIWGAQSEEANRNPSSYIPTVASAVTRNEDRVHITKSKITNWSSPGAVCVHFYKPLQAGTIVSTDDAATEQLGIQASSTTAARAFWSSGQTATGDIGEPVVQKAIHYWDGTTSKFCINGTTVQTETNNVSNFNNTNFITLGAEATDSSGSPGTFSNYANCVIRKVEFYAGQLTDTNLQEITNIGNYTSQYVVVAGGAGGGYGGGGGGGAGGYLESSSYLLVPGLTYSVTVGSGGAGGTNSASATNGNNSSFGSISTVGGGLGGRSVNSGGSGGSGGGGGGWGNGTTTAGNGTAGQGNAGGTNGFPNTNGYPWASGGGGGAGSAGTAPPVVGTGGSGGNGIAFSITGTSVTRAGGGGGGVTEQGGIAGAAGSGGGGSGGTPSVAPGAGSANTGGGGGGGAGVTANLNGAAGGSGVVIIRVPTSNYSGIYTGSPNISQVGDDTVLVFNSSGSYKA